MEELMARVHALPPELHHQIRSQVLAIPGPTSNNEQYITGDYKFPYQLRLNRALRRETLESYFLGRSLLSFTSLDLLRKFMAVFHGRQQRPKINFTLLKPGARPHDDWKELVNSEGLYGYSKTYEVNDHFWEVHYLSANRIDMTEETCVTQVHLHWLPSRETVP